MMMNAETLQAWYQSPLGELVAEAEREAAGRLLNGCCPGFLVQVGAMGNGESLPVANAVRQWVVDHDDRVRPGVVAWHDDLPFRSGSVDTVVVVHQLEFEPDPHRLLREVERILSPEGHVLILAFNPLSLWGLGRVAGPLRGGQPPWCGHYYTGKRLRDWCRVLGLEHRQHERLFFRPPVQRIGIQQRLQRLERLGRRFWPIFGGVHAELSRKRVARPVNMGAAVRRQSAPVMGSPAAAQARRGHVQAKVIRADEKSRNLQRRRMSR